MEEEFDVWKSMPEIRKTLSDYVKGSLQRETGVDYGVDIAVTRQNLMRMTESLIGEFERYVLSLKDVYASLLVDDLGYDEVLKRNEIESDFGYTLDVEDEPPHVTPHKMRGSQKVEALAGEVLSVLSLESFPDEQLNKYRERFESLSRTASAYADMIVAEAARYYDDQQIKAIMSKYK